MCQCATSNRSVICATAFAGLWLVGMEIFVLFPMLKISNIPSQTNIWITMYAWYGDTEQEQSGLDGFGKGHSSWTGFCDGDDSYLSDVEIACSLRLASSILISISFFFALGGSICGCVQGCCATSCCSDATTCGKMSVVAICVAWPFFLMSFVVFSFIKIPLDNHYGIDLGASNIESSYHMSFFLGLVMVLTCLITVRCSFLGCKKLKDSQLGQPSVVGQVIGKV